MKSVKVAAARPPCTCREHRLFVLTAQSAELLSGGPLVAQLHGAWGRGTNATRLMLQLSAVLCQLLCSGRLRIVSDFAPTELCQDGLLLAEPFPSESGYLLLFSRRLGPSLAAFFRKVSLEFQEAINCWPAKPCTFSTACCGYLGSFYDFLQEPNSLKVRIRRVLHISTQ